jgi:VanZ family protein
MEVGRRRKFGAPCLIPGCRARQALDSVSSRRWLPPLLWAAFILILTSIPGSHIPVPPFRYFDKVVHLAIYGVLGWLTARAWTNGSRASAAALAAIIVVSCFGAFDEWHQQFIPQRSMELLDWAADTTGAALGAILAMTGERIGVIA